MISSNDLRPGITVKYKDSVWQVIESMHVKPGKGSAFVQTKLKNLQNDAVLSTNFRAGERLVPAEIEKLTVTYLCREFGQLVFITADGIESLELDASQIGACLDLLKEGQEGITVFRYSGKVIRIEMPVKIELLVEFTPPDERGNTSSGSGKHAILETGAAIKVPFHVMPGDMILVDTRTREYLTRISY